MTEMPSSGDTGVVSAGKPDDVTPAGDAESESAQHDLHWPIPESAMVPLTLALIGIFVWAFGGDRVLVALIPFAALLGSITVIDLRELRVPNRIVGPAAIAALPLLLLASTSDFADLSFVRALLGGLIMGAGYLILALIYPPGMGLGDVKLSPIIGAQLGLFSWIALVRGLALAFLLVGPVAVLLLIFGKARAKTGLPFAPFMAAGAVIAIALEGLT